MKTSLWRLVRCVGAGLALFALRLAQNRTGFEPGTGLALPSLPGAVLVGGLLLTAAGELLLHWWLPWTKGTYVQHFRLPEKETPLLVMGCMLLMAGGALLAVTALLRGGGAARIAAGAMGVAAGGGLLVLVRRLRAGQAVTVLPAIPAMFFGVFFVLAVYLPVADDPVLPRKYLQILATSAVAYGFSRLAGFFWGESNPRWFNIVGELAVILCIAVLADSFVSPISILYIGCAWVIFGFLHLQRPCPPRSKTTF